MGRFSRNGDRHCTYINVGGIGGIEGQRSGTDCQQGQIAPEEKTFAIVVVYGYDVSLCRCLVHRVDFVPIVSVAVLVH